MTVRQVDAGHLEFGGGLEVLLGAILDSTAAGEVIEVGTPSKAVALEIPLWSSASGNEVLDESKQSSEEGGRFVVRIKRGSLATILAPALPPRRPGLPLRPGGALHTSDLLASVSEAPAEADPSRGLVPLGAIPEAGGPRWDWRLNSRDRIWAEELADLTERATASQWDATVDIPWAQAAGLSDEVESAVAQVMTFVAQNEYVALYVPARFLPTVNPAYTDVLLWLASHILDEARHIEVFTKRALVGGGHGYALASTQLSLHTLMEESDFTNAALLLNVLGEGTFLDLLSFIERHGPDPATTTAARLAHRDEQRHVHFGITHIRRVLKSNPEAKDELVASVEARAAKLVDLNGMSSMLTSALTVMASGSLEADSVRAGAKAVRDLQSTMENNRVRRLRAAGFDPKTAQRLSELHTPNLM